MIETKRFMGELEQKIEKIVNFLLLRDEVNSLEEFIKKTKEEGYGVILIKQFLENAKDFNKTARIHCMLRVKTKKKRPSFRTIFWEQRQFDCYDPEYYGGEKSLEAIKDLSAYAEEIRQKLASQFPDKFIKIR